MRVIVADDAVLLREGVVRILAGEGYDVVAAVGSGPELVSTARAYTPDLVVADVRMPPTHSHDGIEAVRAIRAERPGTAAILLSQYIEAGAALDLFRENPAGLGYLLKDRIVQVDDFLDGVGRVARGGSAVDPAVVAQLLGRTPGGRDPLAALTDREREVLALMAEGLSNGGISERLHLGVRTIETYTNAVFTKLDLHAAPDGHRRVRAVLAYLDATRPRPA
ncbi:MAG TPA: response regulator transcription factor [Rugosimonospora sp.]|nr:response regulator transcription factor [Rugosimonospora sp.]